jgi:hypothetical protein
MSQTAEPSVAFLRHVVATIGYRAAKVVRDAPESFGDFRIGPTTRTPRQILAHMGDLLDWAKGLTCGRYEWQDSEPLVWPSEVGRFFAGLEELDRHLRAADPAVLDPERFFQGPLADALTHVGQLAMLRRLADSPVRGESYYRSEIAAGRVGLEQEDPPR